LIVAWNWLLMTSFQADFLTFYLGFLLPILDARQQTLPARQ
jgi:hypothetical protein